MNTNDIKATFASVKSVKDCKSLYRKLAFDFHPDRHLEEKDHFNRIMQQVNDIYLSVLKSLNGEKTTDKETGKEYTYKYNEETESRIMRMLSLLLSYDLPDHVTVTVVGLWVWVEGTTREDKEVIKHLQTCNWKEDGSNWTWKMNYNAKRQAWSFCPYQARTRYNSNASLDNLKSYYGSKTYARSDETAIA